MDILRLPLPSSNGLTLDSIYVVALYTDKIAVSGGPESFGGLPAMILQVAFPHENVSWIATKVEYLTSPMNSISPSTDGTVINFKELINKLWQVFKSPAKNESSDSAAHRLCVLNHLKALYHL
jgi:hypothetical protein